MSIDFAKPGRTIRDADEAQALASAIIARTGIEEAFDAGLILENHPGLAQYGSVVVDLAYEEFCRRLDAGEPADPQEFAQRFPAVAQSLLKVLEVHQYLEHHPDAFTPNSPPNWPQAGEEVSGFALVCEIGRGGFSRVFLAQEKELGDREVVVKICVQANQEAARLGRLDHPHIVPVHSVQSHSLRGFTVICMPYLGSATLADVIGTVFAAGKTGRRGADVLQAIEIAGQRHELPAHGRASNPGQVPWTLRRGSYAEAILEIGAQVCEALAYAHGRGICHCDVKPSNVLLTPEGRSLLLDFNLSTQRGGTAAVVGGTLPYMAPEQLRFVLETDPKSLPNIDHRADLFALGATMFQLLTGRIPFPVEDLAENNKETARRLLDQQRVREHLSGELEPVVSPAIARLIAQCLAFDPDDRPQSAEQVARQFRRELRVVPRAWRWVRSHKATAFGAVAALVLAVTLLGNYLAKQVRETDLMRGWAAVKASQREDLNGPERSKLLRSARERFDASWTRTGNAESAAGLAYCYSQMGYYVEGEIYFAKAVDMGLTTPSIQNNRGYCLLQTGNLEKAAARLEEAIRLDRSLQAAHHNLALVQWGLAQSATQDADDARVDRLKEVAAKHKAQAEELHNSAIGHINAARNCGSPSAEVEFDAACIYASNGLLEEAWASCQAALKLDLPPQKITKNVILASKLVKDPRFQQLLAAPSVDKPEKPTKRLIDIYQDMHGH